MKSHQCTQVELGSLQKLDLADVYVLQGVDALGSLLDLAADHLGDELRSELGEGAGGSLALDNVGHLAADGTDLGRSGISSLLNLVLAAFGEADGEKTNEVVIRGLDGDVGLNEGLPLADERAQLVGCEVETVEVGEAALALHLVNAEANLAERMIFILLEVSEGDLDNTSLECVIGILQTGGTVDESLADISDVEWVRGLNGVPIFAGEGVDSLLLEALLALGESLVLSNRHDCCQVY